MTWRRARARHPRGTQPPRRQPELVDADAATTLHREAAEESQVRLIDPVILGHELTGDQAYLRMAAWILGFDAYCPDPDGGRLLGRRLVPVTDVPLLLGGGESGAEQAVLAARWQRAGGRYRCGLPPRRRLSSTRPCLSG